ncbi:hypothetical protein WKS98_08425 [Lagierella sp. ICN-221743]
MIETIFCVTITVFLISIYIVAFIGLIIDLKDDLREKVYKKDNLNDSVLDIIKYAKELEKYIPKENLSKEDEEYIRVLQEAIKDQLYFMDKLFKRGF